MFIKCQLKRVPAPAVRPPSTPLSLRLSPLTFVASHPDPHPLSTPTAGVFGDKGDNFHILFLQSPEQMAPPEQGKMPSAASEANGASQPGWETNQWSFLLLLSFLLFVLLLLLFLPFLFLLLLFTFFCFFLFFFFPSFLLLLLLLLPFLLLLLLYFFTFCFFLFFFLFFLLPASSASSVFFFSAFFFFLFFFYSPSAFLYSCFLHSSSAFTFFPPLFCVQFLLFASFFVLLLLCQQDIKIQLLATSLLHL